MSKTNKYPVRSTKQLEMMKSLAAGRPVDTLDLGPEFRALQSEDAALSKRDTAVSVEVSEGAAPFHTVQPHKFNPAQLRARIEASSILGPRLSAIVTNTVGYGYQLVPREGLNPDTARVRREKLDLQNFLRYVNSEEGFEVVLRKICDDFVNFGNYYVEIVRDSNGRISGIYHVPATQMSATSREGQGLVVPQRIIDQREAASAQNSNFPYSYRVRTRQVHRRFRLFRQQFSFAAHPSALSQATRPSSSSAGSSVYSSGGERWYKEFGDPRPVYVSSGRPIPEDRLEAAVAAGDSANEIYHGKQNAYESVYGQPEYVGSIRLIEAEIQSQQVNYTTMKNHMIPSAFVMIDGGYLNSASVDRLTELAGAPADSNFSRWVILEAENAQDENADLDVGQARIRIQAMHDTRIEDILFEGFMRHVAMTVSQSLRIPDLLLGDGTAIAAKAERAQIRLADEQVFQPIRDAIISFFNDFLLPAMGFSMHRININSPNVTDAETLAQVLKSLEVVGAVSPKIASGILSDILNRKVEVPSGVDPDEPMSAQMARLVGNQAPPNEVTQQVSPRRDRIV